MFEGKKKKNIREQCDSISISMPKLMNLEKVQTKKNDFSGRDCSNDGWL